MKKLANDKHPSLFVLKVSGEEKNYITLTPGSIMKILVICSIYFLHYGQQYLNKKIINNEMSHSVLALVAKLGTLAWLLDGWLNGG
jgi:hypothetical protein